MKAFLLCQFLMTMSVAAGFQHTVPAAKILRLEDSSTALQSTNNNSRRNFLSAFGVAALSTLSSSFPVYAEENDQLTDVYFGVGCFWHIQHEFVVAEQNLLGRGPKTFTSRTGYAGGTRTDNGKVCYHNFKSIADYGKFGHGEVVGMTIPENKIGDFATEYFNLFTSKGERVDPMDRGGEYRSLIGLPGGMNHPMYPAVEAAANAKGMKLELGRGNDPDTLGKQLVFVYDTKDFPFYQAEVYHQFHNDFQSAPYGKAYNQLADLAFDDGRVKETGCPDRI